MGGDGAGREEVPHSDLVLDKELFNETIHVVALKVPVKQTSTVMQALKADLLNMPKRKNVYAAPGADAATTRLVLLKQSCALSADGATVAGLSDAGAELVARLGLAPTSYAVTVDYSHYTAEEAVRRLLRGRVAGDAEVTHAFESVGHVAHLNLRAPLLPYRRVIGQVILDKNKNLRTVVNKTGEISSEFRTFPMEVLAGDDDTNVEVHESGCTFCFDFREVYWNSRLQAEHARLIALIEAHRAKAQGDATELSTVCDMMAGVGPFAIPLAKRGFNVHANDLNPKSHAALAENARRNGAAAAARVRASCDCGRRHVASLLARGVKFGHVIMNLPASAIDFLDAFRDIDWAARGFRDPPLVHCYCFSRGDDAVGDAIARAAAALGAPLAAADVKVHVVRDVAPKKPMLCLTFRAPACAAAGSGGSAASAASGAAAAASGEAANADSSSAAAADSSSATAASSIAAADSSGAAAASSSAAGEAAAVGAEGGREGGGSPQSKRQRVEADAHS
ncbi:hypothetical protein JKP88DRAFT_269654 [Tribonema minus]|uniref:tRNA (guanine(37)-N1)-methyltransferase n=1 Tax=Tribonema minus TaxID=303371 RepID=A0A835Z8A4_9STRA|nr:hypothetical protein JKP88DRAFT_269654 [Tribonema minus]